MSSPSSGGTYHFIRAEQLLRRLDSMDTSDPAALVVLGMAQTHAQLATAAPALFPAEHLEREVARELADAATAGPTT